MFAKSYEKQLRNLALQLYDVKAVKFGNFQTKVGINTPVYFDLRVIISYPKLMRDLNSLLMAYAKQLGLEYDQLCGVPYTALPIATLLSVETDKPMLIRRKEPKGYGTKKQIEGHFQPNEVCLIIEDVVTSGTSILETVNDLKDEGIRVNDVLVVMDREQGGMQNISANDVRPHSLYTLSGLMQTLQAENKITGEVVESVQQFIKSCQLGKDGTFPKDALGESRNFALRYGYWL